MKKDKEVNMDGVNTNAKVDKPKKVRGNPVLPELPRPLVPLQVRMSRIEEQQPKGEVKGVAPPTQIGDEVVEEEVDVEEQQSGCLQEVETEPKGVINIKLYHHKTFEVGFSGCITGVDISMAWRAMMKQYRVWKHTLLK